MDSPNRQTDAARLYHELTKHSYTSVRTDGHVLDWDNRPFPFKIYPHAAALALPRELNLSPMPTLDAISGRANIDPRTPLDLERLTRVLFCAGGLTRKRRVGMEDYHFRAAASAGALYPIEIYLASGPDAEGLESGLYHFSPADLKLRGLRRGDWRAVIARACAMQRPRLADARAILILSGIFWRSAWKYRARCYRYCFWDAGTMLANVLAAADAEGLQTEVIVNFADAEIERLIGVDGEREGPLCLVAIGRGTPSSHDLTVEPLELETVPLSMAEKSYPDLVRMHHASKLLDAGEVSSVAISEAAPGDRESAAGASIEGLGLGETILRRGSSRQFDREAISAEELAAILDNSSGHPRCDFPPLTGTYLIVNAVAGIAPGAYYYSRTRRALELLKAGDLRGNAGYLSLEQPLGADCSVLICYMGDFDRLLGAIGNRGYRAAQLEAGLHGGRAYLAAYALNRGATGLTFYDDDTVEFFSPHAAGKIPLLMVALGVPA
ncbi:MAG TPA: SagB/ThcOx family dehydrogenase [Candidatus Binataceae bacterium]|jgi:SagB-type dehydrogenase family enzyme|nr:SagB/ThcOx family dehydrogenase [Candidatus Binataceae bacterium]